MDLLYVWVIGSIFCVQNPQSTHWKQKCEVIENCKCHAELHKPNVPRYPIVASERSDLLVDVVKNERNLWQFPILLRTHISLKGRFLSHKKVVCAYFKLIVHSPILPFFCFEPFPLLRPWQETRTNRGFFRFRVLVRGVQKFCPRILY